MMRQPTPAELAELDEAWARAEAQDAYYRQHVRELLARYPDHFVAIKPDGVVAASRDIETLLKELAERGIDRRDIGIRYLETNPRRYIL
jgi:actin-like ATPase involved in cell morphogenesis